MYTRTCIHNAPMRLYMHTHNVFMRTYVNRYISITVAGCLRHGSAAARLLGLRVRIWNIFLESVVCRVVEVASTG